LRSVGGGDCAQGVRWGWAYAGHGRVAGGAAVTAAQQRAAATANVSTRCWPPAQGGSLKRP